MRCMTVHGRSIEGPGLFRRVACAALVVGLATSSLAANRAWSTGTGLWNTAGNWSPVGVPAAGDNVSIGNLAAAFNGTVTLGSPTTVAALTLSDGMRLATNIRSLTVNGPVSVFGFNIVGFDAFRSTLSLGAVDGNSLVADQVQLSDEGTLLLDGAYASVGVVTIGSFGHVRGEGGLSLRGNGVRALINDGYIEPGPEGLAIWQTGTGVIDLDGNSGHGEIWLTGAGADPNMIDHLTIVGTALYDPFDGWIRLRNGAVLDMDLDSGWTLGVGGHIYREATVSIPEPAIIRGSPLTVAGELAVGSGTGKVTVEADATLAETADVRVGQGGELIFDGAADVSGGVIDVELNGHLRFDGPTHLAGGVFSTVSEALDDGWLRFEGPTEWDGVVTLIGNAQQNGTATVTGPSVIHADTFDLDGNAGDTTWNVNSGLVVNAHRTEVALPHVFNGTLNIAGGFVAKLTLNFDDPNDGWEVAGDLNLTGDLTLFVQRLAGAPLDITGNLTLTGGRARVDANTTFADTSTVSFGTASAILRMNGVTSVDADTVFAGQGTLQNGTAGKMTIASGTQLDAVGLANQGLLQLGDGPGVVVVDRFQNTADGTWQVEIGGHAAGAEHDLLIVSPGTATLGGKLAVKLIDDGDGVPFVPEIGDEFTILTALSGVTGTFAQNPQSCAGGVTYQWTTLYGPNDVRLRLEAISTIRHGDLNCDCRNDFADIDLFVSALSYPGGVGWPHTCPWLNADCNGDGNVTFADIDPFVALLGS